MPIVIGDLSGIGQGIQTAGSALAGALEKRAEGRLAQKRQSALGEALADADLQTQNGQQDFLQKLNVAGIPMQEGLGILDRAIKMRDTPTEGFTKMSPDEMAGLLNRLGFDEEIARNYADLYPNLSQGGKTEMARMLIDRMQRRQFSGPGQQQQQINNLLSNEDPIGVPDEPAVGDEFIFPDVGTFEGLLPKEVEPKKRSLLTLNKEPINDANKKRKSLDNDQLRFRQLEAFNNSGKLPKAFAKWNVNWKTGDTRIPALANAETQAFVKTINDFTVKAKETFGARVTNFELQAFMKRLPTLANSEEGRRLIIAQMQAMGAIDQLHNSSLLEVYDHYGMDGINPQKAEKIAADLRAPREEALKQKVLDATMAQDVFDLKARLGEDEVLMEMNGKLGAVPRDMIEVAQSKGARLI